MDQLSLKSEPMKGEIRLLVTDGPIEFEKKPVQVKTSGKFLISFTGIYGLYLILIIIKREDTNM